MSNTLLFLLIAQTVISLFIGFLPEFHIYRRKNDISQEEVDRKNRKVRKIIFVCLVCLNILLVGFNSYKTEESLKSEKKENSTLRDNQTQTITNAVDSIAKETAEINTNAYAKIGVKYDSLKRDVLSKKADVVVNNNAMARSEIDPVVGFDLTTDSISTKIEGIYQFDIRIKSFVATAKNVKVKLYFLPATKGDQRLAFGTVEEAFSFFEIKNIPLGNFIQQRLTRVINPVFNNVNIFLVGTCKNDNGASFDIYETRNLDLKTGRTKHTNAYDGAKIIFNDYLQNKISK